MARMIVNLICLFAVLGLGCVIPVLVSILASDIRKDKTFTGETVSYYGDVIRYEQKAEDAVQAE